MKIDEVRGLTPDQLAESLISLKKEQFNLRFQKATGQIEKTHRVDQVRKDIARIKTHLPTLDHTAAEPGADDRGDRGPTRRLGTEVLVVGVEGSRVAVVVVDDRQPEPGLQCPANVEAPPFGGAEVGGAQRGDDAVSTGRPGRVQTDRTHRRTPEPGHVEHGLEGGNHRLHCRARAFDDSRGHLHQPVDEELARGRQHGGVVGGAAVVDADDDPRRCG